jgi:two-component system, NarL family, response regulator LiaR
MIDSIRILIADDHTLFRNGVKTLLNTEPGMEVIGEASNGDEAIQLAKKLLPDIVLMDLVMPVKDGITAISEIIALPGGTRILVLTSYSAEDKSISAIKAGASGFVLKDCSPDELLQAIRIVHSGESYLPPGIVEILVNEVQHKPQSSDFPVEQLTDREMEVLKLIAQGLTNDSIAATLFISKRTVSTHINNLLNKLTLENRAQAVLYALQNRIVEIE